jgi:hypothetical protein
MRHFLLFLFLGLNVLTAAAQQNLGRITGNIQSNGNFFIRDSAIGAANTPQYDYQKFGAETWLRGCGSTCSTTPTC